MRECIKCGGLVDANVNTCGTCGSNAVRDISDGVVAACGTAAERVSHEVRRDRPRTIDKQMIKGLLAVVVVCAIPFVSHFTSVKEVKTKASNTCQKTALHCVANKVDVDASIQCRDAIERQLKFGGEWDGGLPEFTRYWWVGNDHEVVAFMGNNLQAKNALGLAVKSPFICEYDVTKSSVVKAGLLTP